MANRGLAILQGTGPYRSFQDIKRFIFLFTLGLKKQWKQREMSCCGQNKKHPGSSPVYYGQKTENFKRITGTSKFISLTVVTGVFITCLCDHHLKKLFVGAANSHSRFPQGQTFASEGAREVPSLCLCFLFLRVLGCSPAR